MQVGDDDKKIDYRRPYFSGIEVTAGQRKWPDKFFMFVRNSLYMNSWMDFFFLLGNCKSFLKSGNK